MGFFLLILTLYIGGMIYLANLADVQQFIGASTMGAPRSVNTNYATITRRMLYGLVAMLVLFGLFSVQILAFNGNTDSLAELGIKEGIITPLNLFALIAIASVTGGLCFLLISSENARGKVKRLTWPHSRYNTQSYVHLVAMVLALCLISYILINFVLAGGLQGVAESIEESGLNLQSLIFQGFIFLFIALLGVGLFIRRTPKETIQRLGLTPPTPQHIITGVAAGFIMIALASALTQVWISLVTPEQYAQQTSAAAEISNQITSVQTIFIISLSAAVSEEILFRGALQPVFGLPLTTLFFVSFHDQYTFSPAMLIILSVGLVLALLHRYQSTTSAIIAHFIYNFVPVALVIASPQAARILGLL